MVDHMVDGGPRIRRAVSFENNLQAVAGSSLPALSVPFCFREKKKKTMTVDP
jgi:hypothetical protein